MTDFKRHHLLRTIGLAGVVARTLAAQNAGTTPTLQSLNFKRVLDTRQVLTTLTPNTPPVVVAGLSSGALELRESMNFNPANPRAPPTPCLSIGAAQRKPLAGLALE